MKHLDLFSGFGGFRLAVEHVLPDSELHCFVEYDKFCQTWLRANWPNCRIWKDARTYEHGKSVLAESTSNGLYSQELREFQGNNGEVQTGQKNASETCRHRTLDEVDNETTIDILTGGPPCQPVSVAGKRKGDSDDRWLWPEMLRIIQDVAPRWIVFENVSGLVNFDSGLLFDGICSDMEDAGYETAAFVLPACSQDAPHRRDRVFVVGHAESKGKCIGQQERMDRELLQERGREQGSDLPKPSSQSHVADIDKPITSKERIQRSRELSGFSRNPWSDSAWLTGHDGKARRVPIPAFLQLAYGLSTADDNEHITLLAKGFPHRSDFLKGFGNAIVPQVVIPIMQAIKEIDDAEKYDRQEKLGN